jgi:hypothetical protein
VAPSNLCQNRNEPAFNEIDVFHRQAAVMHNLSWSNWHPLEQRKEASRFSSGQSGEKAVGSIQNSQINRKIELTAIRAKRPWEWL